ncbi:MAG TPA: helix-turn-helix transcriptional regulator [Rickettsiales bacterium]|nr:helix-turn-helix transcriptional regulator [Rickettsiales bacterium]
MQIERFSPSARLAPFVKAFIHVQSLNGMENRILPDTSLILAFRLKGAVHHLHQNSAELIPASVVSGLRSAARLIGYAPGSNMLLVMFREGGAAAFFKEPLHRFFASSIALQDISGIPAGEMEARLAEAKTARSAVAIIEHFLFTLLKENTPDKLVHEAMRRIREAGGIIRIRDLAASLNISLDPFEKRFRQTVGSSPKQFAETVRLRKLIENRTEAQTLTEIAYEAGYFDQSHFTRRFKTFTGQTPTEFFQSPPHW